MKEIIIFALFSVLCFEKGNAQQYDYTDDLYLAIGGIDFGNMCGYDSPNYQPGDVFQYSTHVWIDLKKLYNIPYRRNTFFNGNFTTFKYLTDFRIYFIILKTPARVIKFSINI